MINIQPAAHASKNSPEKSVELFFAEPEITANLLPNRKLAGIDPRLIFLARAAARQCSREMIERWERRALTKGGRHDR